ncbi:MAG: DUF2878 domain-containing protein [Shewanella sp.]|nr:DUF2878 domain-containing protein [Shewanella sp.]MCF1429878.1 DUF2878 domain-containing protein [Shewanella sp.]MCF1438902.1 DUF2878 domain-containing protein [Shewanella sp.]MCF1457799.1 DUF2878 domain-containing protein [Shewanella sp.]
MSGKVWILGNALSFQLVWWGGVLIGNAFVPVSLILLLAHLLFTPCRRADIRLMWQVALIGIAIDGLLIWSGVFLFPSLPWWLGLLWLHFALSINASLSFLKGLPVWSVALLGAVAGPFSYLAGSRFEAVSMPWGEGTTASILGIIWLLLLPLAVWLARMSSADRRTELTETP